MARSCFRLSFCQRRYFLFLNNSFRTILYIQCVKRVRRSTAVIFFALLIRLSISRGDLRNFRFIIRGSSFGSILKLIRWTTFNFTSAFGPCPSSSSRTSSEWHVAMMLAEYGNFRNSSFDGYVSCKLAAQLHVFHLVYDSGRLVLS